MPKLAPKDRPRGFRSFLGYAVFYDGQPFPSSSNTVTRDRQYLMSRALFKLNGIDTLREDEKTIQRAWKAHPKLTLRRVYVEGMSHD